MRGEVFSALAAAAVLLLTACGRPSAFPEEVSSTPARHTVAALDLKDYAYRDRSGTGQADEPKPASERQAVHRYLQQIPADTVVLFGMGSDSSVRQLEEALDDRYEEITILPIVARRHSLVVLNKRRSTALCDSASRLNNVQGRVFAPRVQGVLLDDTTWVLAVDTTRPAGSDYERRRNDMRYVAKFAANAIEEGLNVLVIVDSTDSWDGPLFRYLADAGLKRVPAGDTNDAQWTHAFPEQGLYTTQCSLWATSKLVSEAHIDDQLDSTSANTSRSLLMSIAMPAKN